MLKSDIKSRPSATDPFFPGKMRPSLGDIFYVVILG